MYVCDLRRQDIRTCIHGRNILSAECIEELGLIGIAILIAAGDPSRRLMYVPVIKGREKEVPLTIATARWSACYSKILKDMMHACITDVIVAGPAWWSG